MPDSMEAVYQQRLRRYVTAMRNEKPDRVPIRPFVAEFTGQYAGFTGQEVTHDFDMAFAAVRKCAADFDWDAVVPNMVYVWTGLTQAIGLTYYGIPGIDVPPDTGFQYREPDEEHAFMRANEYDALIDDPTGFLYNVWLPRVSSEIRAPGEPASYRHALALVKGGMAMLQYGRTCHSARAARRLPSLGRKAPGTPRHQRRSRKPPADLGKRRRIGERVHLAMPSFLLRRPHRR